MSSKFLQLARTNLKGQQYLLYQFYGYKQIGYSLNLSPHRVREITLNILRKNTTGI